MISRTKTLYIDRSTLSESFHFSTTFLGMLTICNHICNHFVIKCAKIKIHKDNKNEKSITYVSTTNKHINS